MHSATCTALNILIIYRLHSGTGSTYSISKYIRECIHQYQIAALVHCDARLSGDMSHSETKTNVHQ